MFSTNTMSSLLPDIEWYLYFMYKHVNRVRPATLALVTSIDFRHFAKAGAGASAQFFSHTEPGRDVAKTFGSFPSVFPNLRCILFEGHDFDLLPLCNHRDPSKVLADDFKPPLFLSLAGCDNPVPMALFETPYFWRLVYLDLSELPGSMYSLLTQSNFAAQLFSLRVLKARWREMDDETAIYLFSSFASRLWSLDLTGNRLSDLSLTSLLDIASFVPLHSATHFDREGQLILPIDVGSDTYGAFRFVDESPQSAIFKHPDRYLVDAPAYVQVADSSPSGDAAPLRDNGRDPPREDGADDIYRALTGSVDGLPPEEHDLRHLANPYSGRLTHLHLSGNGLTVNGVGKFLRLSGGNFQHLDFGAPMLPLVRPPPRGYALPATSKVRAFVGMAHLVRPVWSANLRTLRAHHSFVTGVPTVDGPAESRAGGVLRLAFAEELLAPRVDRAFPQRWMPDMNPRLWSLTLMRIPRWSSGAVVDRLVEFLKALGRQARDVRAARRAATAGSRRSPGVVSGLRVLRLEFDEQPSTLR